MFFKQTQTNTHKKKNNPSLHAKILEMLKCLLLKITHYSFIKYERTVAEKIQNITNINSNNNNNKNKNYGNNNNNNNNNENDNGIEIIDITQSHSLPQPQTTNNKQ